jgi:hypothetical protein
VKLFDAFNEYYPEAVLAHRRELFKSHLDQTYFAWIGGIGDEELYYFRIHSPVTFMEFDVHAGGMFWKTPLSPHFAHVNQSSSLMILPRSTTFTLPIASQIEAIMGRLC